MSDEILVKTREQSMDSLENRAKTILQSMISLEDLIIFCIETLILRGSYTHYTYLILTDKRLCYIYIRLRESMSIDHTENKTILLRDIREIRRGVNFDFTWLEFVPGNFKFEFKEEYIADRRKWSPYILGETRKLVPEIKAYADRPNGILIPIDLDWEIGKSL